jgi:hypothetical protein
MAQKTIDRRTEKHPVWREKLAQFTWASGASAADTANFPICGIMRAFVTVVNATTNNITITVAITDEDSYQLYSLGAIADDGTTVTTLTAHTEIFIPEGSIISVTPSGDPGLSGATVDLTFIGR